MMFGTEEPSAPQKPKPEEKKGLSLLDKAGITIFMLLTSTIWRGFVIQQLWAWFISSPFFAPHISFVHAIGLSLLLNVILDTKDATGKDKLADWTKESMEQDAAEQQEAFNELKTNFRAVMMRAFGETFLMPSLILFMGYAIHRLM